MRCGRMAVEGEAEEVIPVSTRAAINTRQRCGKKSSSNNPYSGIGLDKFAGLNAELSAKRKYVAKKTGNPEAQVRFAYSRKGWIPFVVNSNKNAAEGAPGVSILPPIRTKQKEDTDLKNKGKENDDNNEVKAEMDVIKGYGSQAVVPWTGYLMTIAFGVLTVSSILGRKSAEPAAVMALAVMVVCALQRRWQGGVICTKRFVGTALSYISYLFSQWEKFTERKSVQQSMVESPEQNTVNRQEGFIFVSVPTSPVKSEPQKPTVFSRSQEECKNNKKKHGRVVSMDGQPMKPMRVLQQSGSFQRRRWTGVGTIEGSVVAIVMIIVLFFLVFYGRLCAICFSSAWWYVLPKLRIDVSDTET